MNYPRPNKTKLPIDFVVSLPSIECRSRLRSRLVQRQKEDDLELKYEFFDIADDISSFDIFLKLSAWLSVELEGYLQKQTENSTLVIGRFKAGLLVYVLTAILVFVSLVEVFLRGGGIIIPVVAGGVIWVNWFYIGRAKRYLINLVGTALYVPKSFAPPHVS
jgi:hypothetical protein